jgi:hypothetical protein
MSHNIHHQKRMYGAAAFLVLSAKAVDSFSPAPAFFPSSRMRTSSRIMPFLSKTTDAEWNEEHIVHGAANIHEETDSELLESEFLAALDAHDSIDAGMEAAAEERAVMMANEMAKKLKNSSESLSSAERRRDEWNKEHLHYHEEREQDLLEAEEMAAFDAHDCSDPGMEAAAEERAVMMAQDMVRKIKHKADKAKKGFRNEFLDDDE